MISIVHAHPYPHHSRAGKALLAAVRGLPDVAVRELYQLYPDFYIDIAAEQAALLAARTIVWQHPLYWYHAPALMVLWIEKVLALDWAYGARHALAGKRLLWVITTGDHDDTAGSAASQLALDELATPLRRTAEFCRMIWLPPLAIRNAHGLGEDELLMAAEGYRDRLVAEHREPRGGGTGARGPSTGEEARGA
jgi:glutathione-regulated potassium-efflux system ancillary protein KefF